MTEKDSGSKSNLIYKLLMLIPTMLSVVSNVTSLIRKEAYWAGRNLATLVALTVAFACLLLSTWIGLLAVLFFTLIHLQWSEWAAALTVLSLNVVLLLILGLSMIRVKNKLLLFATRK